MAGDIHVIWNDAAIKLLPSEPSVRAAADRLAARAVSTMKTLCPVYTGPPRPGPTPQHPRQVARRSGTLRSSIHAFRQPDGNYLIGPTDSVAPYVNNGTREHDIVSHGPWQLYSAATGRYYGSRVHHPGTTGSHFVERAAESLNGVRVTA